MFLGLRTHSLHVPDLAAARDWYAKVLGVAPYFDEPFYVGFDVGGFELGLQPAEAPNGPLGSSGVYWGVPEVAKAMDRLLLLGASPESAPQEVGGGIVVGSVLDPFGNRLGLIYNPHFRLSAAQAGGTASEGPVAVVDKGFRLATIELPQREIVKEERLAQNPADIWALWSSAKGLEQWLVGEAHVELRIGGAYEMVFDRDAPPGQQGGEGCRILSFLPGRMLSFTWNAPPSLPETRSQYTWVVVEFLPDGEGTLLRLTHSGWPEVGWQSPSQWPETFAYFDAAWDRVMEALAVYFCPPGLSG